MDFTGYEKSYAETSNREVLLNLARLAHHDPTYFFKLGQISSTYQMQAGLSGFGQYVPQGASTGIEVPSGGGTPTATYQNYSAFNFIPVSDETNATLLLQPVSEDVFYNLYQQGWRVDQLFRLLVDRIEITLPVDPGHPQDGCRVEIIRNVPPPPYFAPSYTMSPLLLSRYVEFLRVSAIVYALQRHGLLQITGSNTFAPLDKNAKLQIPPSAKEMVNASANNEVWELQKDGTWMLGKKVLHPRFQLSFINPGPGTVKETNYGTNVGEIKTILDDVIQHDPGLSQLAGPEGAPELTDTLEILYQGFAIGGAASGADTGQDTEVGPCETSEPQDYASSPAQEGGNQSSRQKAEGTGISAHLVMRSLMGLMAAVAQEEDAFDALMRYNPALQPGQDNLTCDVHHALQWGTVPKCDELIEQLCAAMPPRPSKSTSTSTCWSTPMSESPLATTSTSPPSKSFKELVPAIEQLPVLRLTWPSQVSPRPANDAASLKPFGLAVNYRGTDYWISDFKIPGSDSKGEKAENANNVPVWAEEDQSWNRDMFRLICQLSSQVSVDISKFPLPAILQLPIQ